MKTIRTIIATLSAVLLTFALVAWFSVRRNAAFIQRTIYQGFDQTFVVALVMGCAFLLIAVILTVAIFSTEDDDEEEEQVVRPTTRTRPPMALDRQLEERRPSVQRGEEPYRRVSRTRTMDQDRAARAEADSGFTRPRPEAEKPVPKKREAPVHRQDDDSSRQDEVPMKKKAPKAQLKAESRTEAKPKAKQAESDAQPRFKVKLAKADFEPTFERKLSESDPEPKRKATKPRPKPVAEPEGPEEILEEEEELLEQTPVETSEMPKEEGTVRCIFCGSVMSRDSQICPACGKKR